MAPLTQPEIIEIKFELPTTKVSYRLSGTPLPVYTKTKTEEALLFLLKTLTKTRTALLLEHPKTLWPARARGG